MTSTSKGFAGEDVVEINLDDRLINVYDLDYPICWRFVHAKDTHGTEGIQYINRWCLYAQSRYELQR